MKSTIKAAIFFSLTVPTYVFSDMSPEEKKGLATATFHEAYENYNNSFEECLIVEKSKPALQDTEISFLNKSQAGTLVIIEKKSRLAACILPAENNAIRKHIEALNILRSEKASTLELEALIQTIDIYYGLEDESDWERQKRYNLIPKNLRDRFARVVEDKNLEVNFVKLMENIAD